MEKSSKRHASQKYAALEMTSADTFSKLLRERVEQHGDRPAVREKEYGIWQSWTWAEVSREIRDFAAGLASLGFGRLLVYGPLKDTLGLSGDRIGYTAGEAIGPEIFEFYRSLGINMNQFHGQTESSVFITIQPDGEVCDDTVGTPAPGVELKITDDGWVHTGDAGDDRWQGRFENHRPREGCR